MQLRLLSHTSNISIVRFMAKENLHTQKPFNRLDGREECIRISATLNSTRMQSMNTGLAMLTRSLSLIHFDRGST
jgi:hypothetical protein